MYHYEAKVIIPINWRNTKVPPEGINIEGQLDCSMNEPMYTEGMIMEQYVFCALMYAEGVTVCWGMPCVPNTKRGYIGR